MAATVGDGRRQSATAAVRYDLLGSLRATSLLPMRSWRNILRTAQACASRSRQRRGRALCGGPRYGAVAIALQQAADWVQHCDRCSLTHLRTLGVLCTRKKRGGVTLEGSAVRLEVNADHSRALVGCEVDVEEQKAPSTSRDERGQRLVHWKDRARNACKWRG